MFDGLLLQELIKKENNMPLKQILGYPTAEARIEKLLEIKPYADKDAYAMYVRMVKLNRFCEYVLLRHYDVCTQDLLRFL